MTFGRKQVKTTTSSLRTSAKTFLNARWMFGEAKKLTKKQYKWNLFEY
jgi:hypothetical protein